MTNKQVPSTIAKPAAKVEVVIFNKETETSETPAQPDPESESELELVEKQIHRAVERRWSGRSRISVLPSRNPRVVTRRHSMVIPCSEDDSDDELSFF
jgi:hypothetical protein